MRAHSRIMSQIQTRPQLNACVRNEIRLLGECFAIVHAFLWSGVDVDAFVCDGVLLVSSFLLNLPICLHPLARVHPLACSNLLPCMSICRLDMRTSALLLQSRLILLPCSLTVYVGSDKVRCSLVVVLHEERKDDGHSRECSRHQENRACRGNECLLPRILYSLSDLGCQALHRGIRALHLHGRVQRRQRRPWQTE